MEKKCICKNNFSPYMDDYRGQDMWILFGDFNNYGVRA